VALVDAATVAGDDCGGFRRDAPTPPGAAGIGSAAAAFWAPRRVGTGSAAGDGTATGCFRDFGARADGVAIEAGAPFEREADRLLAGGERADALADDRDAAAGMGVVFTRFRASGSSQMSISCRPSSRTTRFQRVRSNEACHAKIRPRGFL
jgi:hypothetical protein